MFEFFLFAISEVHPEEDRQSVATVTLVQPEIGDTVIETVVAAVHDGNDPRTAKVDALRRAESAVAANDEVVNDWRRNAAPTWKRNALSAKQRRRPKW